MQVTASNLFRLYAVSEKEQDGTHKLEAFDGDITAYNEVLEVEELDKTLPDLASVRLDGGGCQCFELVHGDVNSENGKIIIDDGDNDRIEVRDIYDKIDADPEECRFFILVNGNRTEYEWIIAVPQGTAHSG